MKKINILGCGVMGSQIANLFSIMGYEVYIWNRTKIDKDNLLRQKKLILKLLKISDNNGIIKIVDNLQEFPNNITIECLAEEFELKKKFIEDISQKVSKEIFTNSSSIQTNKIGEKINLMHFFNPISLRILEFNKSVKFSREALDIFDDLKILNFELVEVGNYTGFAFNKILFSEISNFFFIIEKENIKKKEILKIFKKINNNLDILNTLDIIGIDTSLQILKNLNTEYGNYYIPEILGICISKKILGKKNKTSIKSIFELENYPT
tara:strand:+ start:91 stop:888 length:798 start_codon:yes stop_codon:yes gene_type:complete